MRIGGWSSGVFSSCLGVRSDWRVCDVRGRFNVSGFIGWYKGVQAPLSCVITNAAACNPSIPATLQPPISPDGDCDPGNDPNGGSLLINSGKSQVSGIDLEGTISPTEWLTLNFGGTILDLKTRSLDLPSELRSEERRVGKECGSTFRSRGWLSP